VLEPEDSLKVKALRHPLEWLAVFEVKDPRVRFYREPLLVDERIAMISPMELGRTIVRGGVVERTNPRNKGVMFRSQYLRQLGLCYDVDKLCELVEAVERGAFRRTTTGEEFLSPLSFSEWSKIVQQFAGSSYTPYLTEQFYHIALFRRSISRAYLEDGRKDVETTRRLMSALMYLRNHEYVVGAGGGQIKVHTMPTRRGLEKFGLQPSKLYDLWPRLQQMVVQHVLPLRERRRRRLRGL